MKKWNVWPTQTLWVGLILVVAGNCGIAVAQSSSDTVASNWRGIQVESNRVRTTLNKSITINFDETPFIDVMEGFREEYGINVLLDQSAIDDSLTEDDPISFRIRGANFGSALNMMLKKHNATYVINDGVLCIISRDVASDPEYFTRRIINCRDLLHKIKSSNPAAANHISGIYPMSAAQAKLRQTSQRAGGGVFDIVPASQISNLVGNQAQEEDATEKRPDQLYLVQRGFSAEARLTDVIKASIAPDDWDDTNGDGSIAFIGGCIVIQHSEEVIADIEQFLGELSDSIQ